MSCMSTFANTCNSQELLDLDDFCSKILFSLYFFFFFFFFAIAYLQVSDRVPPGGVGQAFREIGSQSFARIDVQ